jgi:4-hydroxy-tetrahydrodipicolinate synthase
MTKASDFRGLFPAPSVPFDNNEVLMEGEFSKHIKTIGASKGVNGVLINAHAGELATLTPSERARIIKLTRNELQSGQKIITGVDGLNVPDALECLKQAEGEGADAALVVPPFDYNPRRKMTKSWEAPLRFYETLANASKLPLIIYQFPETSCVSYTTEALSRMAEIDTVVAIKDTTIDGQLYQEHLEALQGRISVLAALDTPDLLGHMILGCDGAIIGVGQLGPALWGEYTNYILAGDYTAAADIFCKRLLPLVTHIFFGRFPTLASDAAKAKEALVQLGVFTSSKVRAPAVGVNAEDIKNIRAGLVRAKLLAA